VQSRVQQWFLHKDMDCRERDILVVIAGPEEGLKFRVVGVKRVSGRRYLHHLEAECERYGGEIG
jgi:hypothetical protein